MKTERHGDVVATVAKKWFGLRDTHGVEMRPGEDEPLLWPRPSCPAA